MFTKKTRKYLQLIFLFLMMTGLLATSCSPQGYRGGYHKKSRRCNCPSFSGNAEVQISGLTPLWFGMALHGYEDFRATPFRFDGEVSPDLGVEILTADDLFNRKKGRSPAIFVADGSFTSRKGRSPAILNGWKKL